MSRFDQIGASIPSSATQAAPPDTPIMAAFHRIATTIEDIERAVAQLSARIEPVLERVPLNEKTVPPGPISGVPSGVSDVEVRLNGDALRLGNIFAALDDLSRRVQL